MRRYSLAAGAGCALRLDTSIGPDGVVPAFAGQPHGEIGSVVADQAGHVFVNTQTTSERWTGTRRDYG
ncbi:MAG: hypothetical protein WCJ30_03340 [Deltaproteobacteria bacterium]